MNKHTQEALKQLQSLSLDDKVLLTCKRIEAFRTWANQEKDYDVFISFSGGKDSTVLKHIVENVMRLNVGSVFFNTGLELPSIQEFVKGQKNVDIVYPQRSFIDIIKEYGYPVISKEVSECISAAKRGVDWAQKKLNRASCDSRFQYNRFKFLLNAPFKVSNKCCYFLKKKLSADYSRKNKKYPILGLLAEESQLRRTQWIKYGCNITGKKAHSNPLSFWTEQDILKYIYINNLEIADCYGTVNIEGGENLFGDFYGDERFYNTGVARTGCSFCLFGASKDSRFLSLRIYHKNQYDYAMGGGEFNAETGFWEPNKKGLGLKFVIDYLNKYLKKKIKY